MFLKVQPPTTSVRIKRWTCMLYVTMQLIMNFFYVVVKEADQSQSSCRSSCRREAKRSDSVWSETTNPQVTQGVCQHAPTKHDGENDGRVFTLLHMGITGVVCWGCCYLWIQWSIGIQSHRGGVRNSITSPFFPLFCPQKGEQKWATLLQIGLYIG